MVLRSRSKAVLALIASAALLGGCADYMNNWDTVSFRAGNAQDANTGIQEISPWPPNVENTDIQFGG